MPSFRSFANVYTQREFPLSYKLRQHMYLQAMVETNDNRLSIAAQKCFATPTPNENDVKAYTIIDDGLVHFKPICIHQYGTNELDTQFYRNLGRH